MLFFHLFIRTNQLFKLITDDDYQLIRWIVLVLMSLSFTASNYTEIGHAGAALVSGIFVLATLYLLLVYLVPVIFKAISSWSGGVGTKNDMSNVIFLSLLPYVPAMLLEGYSEMSGNYYQSSEIASLILRCVSLKISILGISYYNVFSIKNSAIVLITFYGTLLVLAMVIGG